MECGIKHGMDYGMLIQPVVQVIMRELILWPRTLNCNLTLLHVPPVAVLEHFI